MSWEVLASPMDAVSRTFISVADLLVNVTATISFGRMPWCSMRWTIREVRTRVLPGRRTGNGELGR